MINGNGVAPNIRVPLSAEQEHVLFALRTSENAKPEDERNMIKSKDAQMMRAIDAIKGVMIYAQQTGPKVEAGKKVISPVIPSVTK